MKAKYYNTYGLVKNQVASLVVNKAIIN